MTEEHEEPEKHQRHGCLTAWLIIMIIVNSLTALSYLFLGGVVRQHFPHAPSWAIPVLIASSILNVFFAIDLFRWKKRGFWGFCLTTIIALAINLILGIKIVHLLLGLIGIAILYGVLHIGKENKAWPQLE